MRTLSVALLLLPGLTGCGLFHYKTTNDLRQEADQSFREGNYPGAIDANSELISRDDEDFAAVLQRAVAFDRAGNSKEALADYKRALDLKPEEPLPRLYRANLNVKLDRIAAAEDDVSALLASGRELAPRHRMALYTLSGSIHEKRSQLPAAVKDYEKAIALGRSQADLWAEKVYRDALYDAAEVYYQMGHFDLASKQYEELVSVKLKLGEELTSEDYYNLGILAYLRGNFGKAKAYFGKASPEDRKRAAAALKDEGFFTSSGGR